MSNKTEGRVLGNILAREQMAAVYGGDIVVETTKETDEVEEEEEEQEDEIQP